MDFKKIIAAIVVVLGIILMTYGFTELDSLESQFTRALGQKDNNAMGSIIGGAVLAIIGLYLIFRKR
ncbi:DUF3185 family protein [Ancylomarina sp.]|uniref:DUF3185 family protein n=1 Tax=Ancylomarina sp. TaxID=1970196 RepID=UPI0035647E39